jgi:hypothetical protein
MSEIPADMNTRTTAEVSEDAEAVFAIGDPVEKIQQSAYTQSLDLVAKNTLLRLRIVELERKLEDERARADRAEHMLNGMRRGAE